MRNILFYLNKLLFAIMMAVILVLVIFFQDVPYACKKNFLVSNRMIAIAVLLLFAAVIVLHYLRKRNNHCLKFVIDDKSYDRVAKYATLCLLVTDIYISYNIFFTNGWDPGGIWTAAVARHNGDLGWSHGIAHYFSMYPNNTLLLLLETACLKMNSEFGIFVGNYNMMSAIVVDCVTICSACYLTYKVLTLHVRRQTAFGGFLVGVVLFGLSPWMTICYSDSLGILFPVLTYYLYTKPARNSWMKRAEQILAVVVCCIGYYIKPQCMIMLIAIVLIELFTFYKERRIRLLVKPLALLVVACLSLAVTSSILTIQYESIGVKLDPEMRFGMAHFFAMGMNEADGGVFSQEDVDYSFAIETSKERTAANLAKGIERVQKMGFTGFIRHLSRKLLTTYHDGTFAWGSEGSFYIQVVDDVNTCMTPFLKSIYYLDGNRHEIFKLTEQFIWIAVLIFTFASGLIKQAEKNRVELSILMLAIVGLTIFEMLFEVRARYLFLYAPIFCILATLGFENMYTITQEYIHKTSKNIEWNQVKD